MALDATNFVTAVCRDVAELPDRNSPADWPEAMLVTAEELQRIISNQLVLSVRGTTSFEIIEWLEPHKRPDAEETILITLADGDVVPGSFDGELFLEYDYCPINSADVVAWAKWPEGARA